MVHRWIPSLFTASQRAGLVLLKESPILIAVSAANSLLK